jgi:hypothetical protein
MRKEQTVDYGLIGKIEKAKRYAEERAERVQFKRFTVEIAGENNTHSVHFDDDTWQCDCDFFKTRGVCTHVMTLERILEGMIPGPGETHMAQQ